MIKKLRRKFIGITMMSVFAVLFMIVVAVNAVNVYQNNRSADTVTQMLLDNNGSFRKNMTPMDKAKPDMDMPNMGEKPYAPDASNDFRDRFHSRDELPFSTRYFTITLDNAGSITGFDLENIASVTESDIDGFAKKIISKNNTVGWYKTYRYRVGQTENGSLIIAMEATNIRGSVLSVLCITLIVGLAAFLIVFILVALFSEHAIQPISETYEKQKQFITDASHELKTPLTVIAANAEVIGMTYGENEWTEGITRQSEHMRSLITKMIQMSKLDEGRKTLEFEKFNLSDAVFDTAMSFSGIAESKGLKLSVDTAPDIGFNGDEAAVRQVISILMDNAIKYCDKAGEIKVCLKKTKSFGREKLNISVGNTYSAASSLETDKLFQRFYRGDKAHTAGNSFGLGLPIAKSVVELHGGTINIRTAQNGFTEFYIALPQ